MDLGHKFTKNKFEKQIGLAVEYKFGSKNK
jgi:hypothetical protein